MTLIALAASPSRRARRSRTRGSELFGGVISSATLKVPAAKDSASDIPSSVRERDSCGPPWPRVWQPALVQRHGWLVAAPEVPSGARDRSPCDRDGGSPSAKRRRTSAGPFL